jgi:hypothetical protein
MTVKEVERILKPIADDPDALREILEFINERKQKG